MTVEDLVVLYMYIDRLSLSPPSTYILGGKTYFPEIISINVSLDAWKIT